MHFKTASYYIVQAGLKLTIVLPQSAGIIDMYHHAQLLASFKEHGPITQTPEIPTQMTPRLFLRLVKTSSPGS
jgi:hypothetical protein